MRCHCGRPGVWDYEQTLSGTNMIVKKMVCDTPTCVMSVRMCVPEARLSRHDVRSCPNVCPHE